MLQDAYFLAKFGADTAENEQHFAEILLKIGNYRSAYNPASNSKKGFRPHGLSAGLGHARRPAVPARAGEDGAAVQQLATIDEAAVREAADRLGNAVRVTPARAVLELGLRGLGARCGR